MAKEKTTVLIDLFFQLRANTGIKTYTNTLINGLKKTDQRVEVLYYPSIEFVKKHSFFRNDTRIRRWVFHIFYHIWKTVILSRIGRWKQIDVLISPDYLVPPQKTKFIKIPVIHSSFFWDSPENYSASWLKYYKKMIAKGLKQYRLAFTTSDYTKDRLDRYLKNLTIRVAYQAIEIPQLQVNNSIEKKNVILHVGYFDKRKNLMVLVEAFEKLSRKPGFENFELHLIGGSATPTNDSTEAIKTRISELGIEKKVRMPGHATQTTLESAYKEAKLYVFPSINEGFGIPILEAFSFDLPVLVSDHGPLKEVGGDGVKVFNAHDADDLCFQMEQILENPKIKEEMINKGRQRLLDFSPRLFADSILNFAFENLKDG